MGWPGNLTWRGRPLIGRASDRAESNVAEPHFAPGSHSCMRRRSLFHVLDHRDAGSDAAEGLSGLQDVALVGGEAKIMDGVGVFLRLGFEVGLVVGKRSLLFPAVGEQFHLRFGLQHARPVIDIERAETFLKLVLGAPDHVVGADRSPRVDELFIGRRVFAADQAETEDAEGGQLN